MEESVIHLGNYSGTTEDKNSYLTFKLDNEVFATPVEHVQSIMQVLPITHVPRSPDHMKGVVNLRGKVLPVIDTKIKFGLSPVAFTEDTVILVLEMEEDNEKIEVGALVDSVEAVIEVGEDEMQKPNTQGAKFKSDYILYLIPRDNYFINLLDINKLFATEDAKRGEEEFKQPQ